MIGAPQGAAPTPPPGPTPPSGAAQPPTPEPARPRRWRWIALGAVGAAALVLVTSGIVVAQYSSAARSTIDAYEQAEVHYAAAIEAVESVEGAETVLEDAEDPERAVEEFSDRVVPAVSLARTELDAAEAAVAGVGDSAAKASYVASLVAARNALDEIERMVGELSSVGSLAGRLGPIGDAVRSANSDVNAGAAAASKGAWDEAIAAGQSATERYDAAIGDLAPLATDYPDLGLDDLSSALQVRRQAADQLIAACKAATAGNQSAYDQALARFNELAEESSAQELPAALDDPTALLDQFFDAYRSATEQLRAADAAHDEALRRIEAGEY